MDRRVDINLVKLLKREWMGKGLVEESRKWGKKRLSTKD